MKLVLSLALMTAALFLAPLTASALETRCGWLQNPTPANYWLTDADGTWIIAAQGGYQAPGMENLPDFNPSQFVETNGSHGYGCACLEVSVNRRSERITYIAGGRTLRLAKCLKDPNLPTP